MEVKKIQIIVLFCLALLAGRIIYTGSISYLFLVWNLFLAWLPFALVKKLQEGGNKYCNAAIAGLSILFLPNAPYIVTDLFHLGHVRYAPLWLDLILLLSFSFAGMYYFIRSVDALLKWMSWHKNSLRFLYAGKIIIMLLSAYGVYLGRYLRFNSWDIVSDPVNLVQQMIYSVCKYSHFKETMSMTFTFAIFLFVIYEMCDRKKLAA
jgi:uncharacterized membrane protein